MEPRTLKACADLLNPQTTKTFIGLTHERYAAAVGSHFGQTIKFTFTDEPAYRYRRAGAASSLGPTARKTSFAAGSAMTRWRSSMRFASPT